MAVTASDFRKNLFQLLDKAAHGENVEISYQGVTLKVVAISRIVPKLSRVRKRNVLAVLPEEIITNERAVQEMEVEWEAESRETGA
jgi:prevent-host-death family protein